MIETHICPDCAPYVAREVASQALGSPAQPMLLCPECTSNMVSLFEPPGTLPWVHRDDLPYAHRQFDVMQPLGSGAFDHFQVKAELFPLES